MAHDSFFGMDMLCTVLQVCRGRGFVHPSVLNFCYPVGLQRTGAGIREDGGK